MNSGTVIAPSLGTSRKAGATVLVLLGFLGMFGLGMILARATQALDPWRVLGWAFASLLFGALVGLSEILSRYRDEPLLAATTVFGLSYLLLNGVISLAAFVLLRGYSTQIFPVVENDLFLTATIAGFGAMTIFRSKLFTYRSSDGKEYAIGPAIVLETILKTIDHKIDRRRATERQAKIFAEMRDLSDFNGTAQYIEASLNSFQNLTTEEKTEIIEVINEYRKLLWPEKLKIMALGFAFLNIAGEENFDQVMRNMRQLLLSVKAETASASPPPPGAPPP